jgi:hypothetical protein
MYMARKSAAAILGDQIAAEGGPTEAEVSAAVAEGMPTEQQVAPPPKVKRVPRVKGPDEWTPARPWGPVKGKLAEATIEVLTTEHTRTGKAGKILDIIVKSTTPQQAVDTPISLTKDGAERTEYMDPGYVRWAEKLGMIKLNYPAPPEAVAIEAPATAEQPTA